MERRLVIPSEHMNAGDRPWGATVYDSARRRTLLVDDLRELYGYRDLLVQLIARNIKTRYKRSVLGIAWTMLNPLLTMAVLAVVFSALFVTTVDHYPVYVLTGIIVWTFFAQTTSAIMSELIWGGSLMHRVYMPRTVFAVSALGTALVNLLLSLVPLLLIMLASGAALSPALLFLPVPILLLALFALGLGLALSTLALQFGDVLEMYQILLTAWMYFTPVMYPIEIIPLSYRWAMFMNPMYYMLELFRLPVMDGRLPDAQQIAIATAIAVVTFIGGLWFFSARADEIAYRI